ncbi:MAG: serpin family protein [Planctomycetaceae bacterium]
MKRFTTICLVLVSCSTVHAQSRRDPLVAKLGSAEQRFAEKIYASVAKQKTSGNLLLAPYGVFESLTMLQLGAGGETFAEIAKATGIRPDRSAMNAFKRVRQTSFPTSLRFGSAVSDNDRYGVKVLEEPAQQVRSLGIGKGDLIFSVDGQSVRSAREFTDACSQSTGTVRLNGYSFGQGRIFTSVTVPLERARDIDVEPAARVMNFASGLWLRDDFVADSPYPDRLQQLFETRTFATSFQSIDEIAQQANDYFRGQTGGRINEVRMPKRLGADTVMLLMNAMAMDAKWERRFKSALTKPGSFVAPDGELETEYMRQQSVFAFANLNGLRVLELPYRSSNLRMTIFLPEKTDGWKSAESNVFLNSLELHNLSRQMRPTRVDLKLPKFEIQMSGSLKSSAEAIGLGSLFTREANFTGIDAKNRVTLDDVRQQVYIATNEEGTRAGSVTQAVGILKSAPMKAEAFHAVHPFLFLIRDSNGVVYFAGRVTQPIRVSL